MCIALTKTSPSATPDLRTASSTWAVMFTKPMRAGTLNVRCSVCDFMRAILRGGRPAAQRGRGGGVGSSACDTSC